jgi:helix-turn-helix protein
MWSLFEPVHAVTYFAPAGAAAFEAAGLRGFWRRYFAGRAAPLGAVGPGPVVAAFFGFAPAMVARALPDVWTRITPRAALDARAAGARAALTELISDLEPDRLAEAADLLSAAARAVDLPGRVLGAANADLPWPAGDHDRLWQAATVLREHRGDGHVAALLTAGVDGCESLVWRDAIEGGRLRESTQPARGWTDDEWAAAARRLTGRGWLAADGSATAAARTAYAQVEALTDRLAAGPWRTLGAAGTERCAEVLGPLVERIWPVVPANNPIPLPVTRRG